MNKTTTSHYNWSSSSGDAHFWGSTTANASLEVDFPVQEIISANEEINGLNYGKYSVFEVANWFLNKESMTHKKLQKLCYYAQAWFYALKDIKLEDTVYEAWAHGPVSPALYDKFKAFGYHTIRLAGEYRNKIEKDDLDLLESVWETYGDHTGNALEALSHTEMPWIEARKGYAPGERCNVVITPEDMKNYYLSIYEGAKN